MTAASRPTGDRIVPPPCEALAAGEPAGEFEHLFQQIVVTGCRHVGANLAGVTAIGAPVTCVSPPLFALARPHGPRETPQSRSARWEDQTRFE